MNGTLAERTIEIDGPIDCSYTVIEETIPDDILKARAKFAAKAPCKGSFKEDACVVAIMELFHDPVRRARIATQTRHCLRLIDPRLMPWKVGQSITDANPEVLAATSFFMNFCFPMYWVARFESDASAGDNSSGTEFRFWCREHEKFEYARLPCQLLMQLGAGFLNFDDWVFLLSSLKDRTQWFNKNPVIQGTAHIYFT